MVRFRDLNTNTRLAQRNEAEEVFEEWAPTKDIAFVRYGWRTPPFDYFKFIPSVLRKSSDYFCECGSIKFAHIKNSRNNRSRHFFLESKGFGRENCVRIKEEDLAGLERWQKFGKLPVVFFLWNQYKSECSIGLTLDMVQEMKKKAEQDHYHDGPKDKLYYKIPASWVDGWEPFEYTAPLAA